MVELSVRKTGLQISNGNSKLGNVPNLSLMPGKSCGNVPCKRDCYALNVCRYAPQAKRAWLNNLRLATHDLSEYFRQLSDYLTRKQPRYFRWHVGGDIPSQEYLNHMILVACKFPAIRFLAFTKQHHLDYSGLPKNLAIVFSFWPAWGNETRTRKLGLPIAWMDNGNETRIPKSAIQCPGTCDNCAMCWSLKSLKRDVVFIKH